MQEANAPLTNPELSQALERMNREDSRDSREAVLDVVITTAKFLAPVVITPTPGQAQEGDTTLGEGTAIQFQLIANQEGQPYFPAFTCWEQLRKLCGPVNQQTVVLTFDDYAAMVLRDNRSAGFVVDPFDACLSFDREMITHLVGRKQGQTPAT